MRYMGIDYGSKRVGVALSDEGGAMAFPHSVLLNEPALVEALKSMAEKEGVGSIIVGYSIDRDGAHNAVQKDIATFVHKLASAVSVPVVLEEERYTTQAALRIQGRTEQTDASAAALILDSYLTRVKHLA